MKQNFSKFLVFLLVIMIQVVSFAQRTNSSHVHVNGYTRSNGTYVQPHYRTAPNSTNRDNFSTSGNTNPYTGQAGWIAPDNKPLTVPQTSSYPSSSSSAYSYPTSTSSSSDFDYEKYKRDLETERIKNSTKNEDYWLKMPAYTPSSSSYNYNSTPNLREYNPYSTNETVTTLSKSVRSSINYHDRYSWEDKMILEKVLDKLGYSVGSIDGDIDESTIDAIKEFQRDNGLSADGKAGDATVKKIAAKLRE